MKTNLLITAAHHALTCADVALATLLNVKRNAISANLRAEYEAHIELIRATIAKLEANYAL